jgi:hypothetical protein
LLPLNATSLHLFESKYTKSRFCPLVLQRTELLVFNEMKRKILKSITALVLSSVVLTSCLEDPKPVLLDALPDVFIQKVVQDSVPKYGIAFWLLANKDIHSVTVSGAGSGNWSLEADASNNRVFTLFPEPEDYTDSIPDSGDYIFTVTSTRPDEAPRTFKDKLEDDELGIMIIDTVYFDSGKLNASWQSVGSADAYYVRMYDESDKLVFMSPQIANDETDYSFGLYDTGWADSGSKASNGEAFRLEVLAILYESSATSADQNHNVQFISIAPTEIVWDE